MTVIGILIFIFGMCIGSFLNVVVLRSHAGKKFTWGRSVCPKCQHVLSWQENIPLLSFMGLRGKCAQCHKKISWQYPVVELVTGVLFLFSFLSLGNQEVFISSCFNICLLIFYLITVSFLVLIFVYDLKYTEIPDKISLPAILVIFILQIVLFVLKNNFEPALLLKHVGGLFLAALVISGFFAIQFFLSKGKWIGGGDIRLGFLMGVMLDWPYGLVALFLAYIIGLIICLPLLVLGKKKMQSEVPMGVFLTAATFIILIWGDKLLGWYLSLYR